jgi:hypothetical protein
VTLWLLIKSWCLPPNWMKRKICIQIWPQVQKKKMISGIQMYSVLSKIPRYHGRREGKRVVLNCVKLRDYH